MIIVSQDEDTIINFEKTQNLWIDDNILDKTDVTFDIVAEETTIASYKTEERAKEVLKEIVKKYSSYLELKGGPAIIQGQMDIQPNIFNIPKVYEMPKE